MKKDKKICNEQFTKIFFNLLFNQNIIFKMKRNLVTIFFIFSKIIGLGAQTPVQILGLSTRIDNPSQIQGGSLLGGTLLYIRALGLDQTPSNNIVRIGNNPNIACSLSGNQSFKSIDKGVNGLDLACQISASLTSELYGQQVYVTVAGSPESTCSTCKFSFLNSRTPNLINIIPRSVLPTQVINWRGAFVVTLQDEVQDMLIGGMRCSRFDLDKTSGSSSGNDTINSPFVDCQVANVQIAGYNGISLRTDAGFAKQSNQSTYFSVTNFQNDGTPTRYSIITLAQITNLGTNQISPLGQLMSISGLGFPNSLNNVQVYAAGVNATVISSSSSQIIALIPAFPATYNPQDGINQYVGGGGLRWTLFDLSQNGMYDCNALRAQVLANISKLTIMQDGIRGEPHVADTFGYQYGQYYRGYFKAPRDGAYRFFLASDDCSSMWMNPNPNDPTPANMTQIAYMVCCSSEYNYFNKQTQNPTPQPNQKSIPITLSKNQYYYIEIYHIQNGGPGFLSVAAEIPYDTYRPDSFSQIQAMNITYTSDNEIIDFKVYNSQSNSLLSGSYQLQFIFVDPAKRIVLFNCVTQSISPTATTSQIQMQIANSCNYQNTVKAIPVDHSGNDLSTSATVIAGYRYIITITQVRSAISTQRVLPNIIKSGLSNGTVGYLATKIQDPTPQISGTFQLTFKTKQILYNGAAQIPSTIQDWQLQQAITAITNTNVQVWHIGACTDYCVFYIRLVGLPGNTQLFVADASGLIGGRNFTRPQIQITEYEAASTNVFLDPIPSEVLYTAHNKPQVQVQINGVWGACQDSICDLTIASNSTPTLNAYTYNSQSGQLSLTLTDPRIIQYTAQNLIINFGGQSCTQVLTPSQSQVTCQITPNLEAGSWLPQINIQPIGYPKIASTIQPIQQLLNITSVSPAGGSIQGGSIITVLGQGFPTNPTRLNGFTILMGGTIITPSQFTQVSANSLIFLSPAMSNNNVSTIIITSINNSSYSTSNSGFTYLNSLSTTIQSINPSTSSPVKKVPITIVGTNFGTDITQLQVFLVQIVNASFVGTPKQYQLNILSQNNTQINAFLGGGKSGQYQLRVVRNGYGYSMLFNSTSNNIFQYVVMVNSVSPNVGSIAGGTIITIVGQNFSPGDMQVFIGDAVNWLCNILTQNKTTIICLTPPQGNLTEYNNAVNIYVISKLVEQSSTFCNQGQNCQFTYTQAQTPIQTLPSKAIPEPSIVAKPYQAVYHERRRILIQNPFENHLFQKQAMKNHENHLKHYISNPQRRQLLSAMPYDLSSPTSYLVYKTGDIVSINGVSFGTNPSVLVGIYSTVTNFTSSSDTQLVFPFPSVPTGIHLIQVVHSTKGFANGAWNAHVLLTALQTSPSQGSRGGQLITILGGGFNTQIIVNAAQGIETRSLPRVLIGGQQCSNINVLNSETITCITPPFSSDGKKSIVVLQQNIYTLLDDTTNGWNNIDVELVNSPLISNISPQSFNNSDQIDIVAIGLRLDANVVPQVYLNSNSESIVGTVMAKTATQLNIRFLNAVAGKYSLQVIYNGSSYATYTSLNTSQVNLTLSTFTATSGDSSILGGAMVTISGKGFSSFPTNNNPFVCGFPCSVMSANYNQIMCTAPELITKNSQALYDNQTLDSQIDLSQQIITYDQQSQQTNNATDNNQQTFYQSNVDGCYVRIDFGASLRLKIKQLQYFPSVLIQASLLQGGFFDYSSDGRNYTTLKSIDNQIHGGWNYFVLADGQEIDGIRYLRYSDPYGFTNGSQCQMAEIQITGWLLYYQNLDLSGASCPVSLNVNGQVGQGSGSVVYRNTLTPIVTSVNPPYGKSPGGIDITIAGSGFGASTTAIQVLVDSIPCVVKTVSPNQIVCTTGNKDASNITMSMGTSFQVSVNSQNSAIMTDNFFYANNWSDDPVWGGDVPPRDGDVVVIPMGQVLMVDIPVTPKLYSILVEGTLIFKDGIDISLNSNFILIRMGIFQIGTYQKPHQNKVTITLSGNIYDLQLPEYGNKFIGCHHCQLDIHGVKRDHTWSLLSTTAQVGSTVITLINAVDWQVGEIIVIAATQFNHLESEQRQIVSITSDYIAGTTRITLDSPLIYRHYSSIEQYGLENFPMQAEVGLLTRNIVIQGDPLDSINSLYGAHLMIHGSADSGSMGRISYAEFRNVGQQSIIGRYPIHFHLNGVMQQSYVEGNSIHDSHARIITIHGVHYLRVLNNVGYRCLGHAIFLEDGIETYNVIENNLIIGNQQSFIMLQTDITTASYWITNPLNYVNNNHAGGSEWYAFWYEIKDHPDGPSATSDICPPGLPIGSFNNNTAHSNGRFGLRILEMAARQYPCQASRSDNLVDPFSANPSIGIIFSNFTTFSNNQSGVLGEVLGSVTFTGFKIADSKLAGFQTHRTNLTKEGARITNFLIIGQSNGNANQAPLYYFNTIGIIAPRTNNFHVDNVRFYNFLQTMIFIKSCSQCDTVDQQVTGSKNTFFSNIQMFNSNNAQVIYWEKQRREIFWDLDGSITNTTGGAYIVPYKSHLDGIPGCINKIVPQWNNSIICSMNKVIIRDFLLNNPLPEQNFLNMDMQIHRIAFNEQNLNLTYSNKSTFQQELMIMIEMSNDIKSSFASPLAVNYTYNIHWHKGIDFTNLAVQSSEYFSITDPGFIIRFNYTQSRELFDLTRLVAGQNVQNFTGSSAQLYQTPDPMTCRNADWFNDIPNGFLYVCFSGKGRQSKYEYINVNSVVCRFTCPNATLDDGIKINKLWSNESDWLIEGLAKPTGAEAEVVILHHWRMTLDENTPLLQSLIVDGDIIFADQTQFSTGQRLLQSISNELILSSKLIWVRQGSISIGNISVPYAGRAAIELHGNIDDPYLIVDPFVDASNKALVITGSLNIYASNNVTVWTRLASYATAGDQQITVLNAQNWQIGDQIALGPSGRSEQQHEKKTITAVHGSLITLDSALQYDHYGAANVTIDRGVLGQMDMRAGVGHLTRNIQIRGDNSDNSGWGGRVLVYQFVDNNNTTQRGSTQLYGVEFINMGQRDTDKAGLDLRYLNDPATHIQSVIQGCSFHESQGQLFSANTVNGLLVDNNFFYFGVKILAQMINGQNNIFSNNLLIYVRNRQNVPHEYSVLGQFVGDMLIDADYTIANLQVSGNVGQGSEDSGFFMIAVPCDSAGMNGIINNTVSATVLAGMSYRQQASNCSVVRQTYAFHTARGIMAAMVCKEIRIESIILAENDIGVVVKAGIQNNYNNYFHSRDWYITSLARPDCPQCYSQSLGQQCKNQIACQMTAIASIAFPPLIEPAKPSTVFDVVCTIQQLDGRHYLTSLTFENFKMNYSSFIGNNKPDLYQTFLQCGNNKVFRPHPGAVDVTVAHYLQETQCLNCDDDSKFQFLEPNVANGWIGGCGQFECTGQWNVLLNDMDGKFLGTNGQSSAISNNPFFGPSVPTCKKVNAWDGYLCSGNNTGILEFVSIAPDYNTRMYSPVYLSNGIFNNKMNSLKEWNWDGAEPLNTRESKFSALVQLNSVINMTNTGQNPSDSQYWINKRQQTAGLASDWVIIKLWFQTDQVIQVLVGQLGIETIINPFALSTAVNLHDQITVCGANNYFPFNNTIHFVVTGEANCLVRVRQINSVLITMQFQIDYDKFFADSNQGVSFDNVFFAFLSTRGGIDTSQVKTVGYSRGSVIRQDYIIVSNAATDNDNQTLNKLIATQALAVALQTEMAKPDGQFANIGYKVAVTKIQVSKPINLTNLNSTEQPGIYKLNRPQSNYSTQQIFFNQSGSVNNIVPLAVGLVVGLLALILILSLSYYYFRIRNKKMMVIIDREDISPLRVKSPNVIHSLATYKQE